jgi:hypothetical protein
VIVSAYDIYRKSGGSRKTSSVSAEGSAGGASPQTNNGDNAKSKGSLSLKPLAERFKDTFARNIRVHFVGVWLVCATY